jgi:hypothetical protein
MTKHSSHSFTGHPEDAYCTRCGTVYLPDSDTGRKRAARSCQPWLLRLTGWLLTDRVLPAESTAQNTLA